MSYGRTVVQQHVIDLVVSVVNEAHLLQIILQFWIPLEAFKVITLEVGIKINSPGWEKKRNEVVFIKKQNNSN